MSSGADLVGQATGSWDPARLRIVFMGTPEFAVASLARLVEAGYDVVGVVTQPDRPAGRGRQLAQSPVKRLAEKRGLPVYQPERLRAASAVEPIRRWAPDLVVVAAFGQILPKSMLELPAYGCLNVHASLLPAFRGASPITAAIVAGLEETGVTIMKMDTGLDTGPILTQRAEPILPADTGATLTDRLSTAGAELLVETIPAYTRGEITPRSQHADRATYAGMLRRGDGEVDWKQSAETLHRRWRAFQPWPGLYTWLDGKLLKLVEVRPVTEWKSTATPGEVFTASRWDVSAAASDQRCNQAEGALLLAATGLGALLLERVQIEGRRTTTGAELARGYRGLVGSVLGAKG